MLDNSKNIVITGGTFVDHRHNGRSPMELLKERIAPGAFHNSSERYDPPKCHPHTRLAVLEAIIDWIKDGQKTSFLMWLYGPAGAGKSAIAQTIAEMCHKLGILAASFFWSRSAAGRNDETRLIATLAYQLIIAIPQMRIHVEAVIETDPMVFSRSVDAQMQSLIIGPLENTFPDRQQQAGDTGVPRLIIFDGLDECSKPRVQRYILEVISTAIHRFPLPVHFLVASRPEQEIRDSFNVEPLLSLTTRLSLDDSYLPDDDIRLFFVDSFKALKSSHILRSLLPSEWPTAKDIDALVRKSSGQFMYAATVVKFVKSTRRRPDEQLKVIFGLAETGKQTPYAELDALYLHIFSVVEDFPRVAEILSCLFFLDSYLAASEMEDLLFYNHGDLYLALSDLHSVLDVPDVEDDREVRIFHASLQDFLMDSSRSGPFILNEGLARAQLTRYIIRHIRDCPIFGLEISKHLTTSHALNAHSLLDLGREIVSLRFVPNCLKASPTRDLLQDFLSFNFNHWVLAISSEQGLEQGDEGESASSEQGLEEGEEGESASSEQGSLEDWDGDDWFPLEVYEQVILLSSWFQSQESTVKEFFGPEMSLYDRHSVERDMTINKLLQEAIFDLPTREGANAHGLTAITHPLLLDVYNRSNMRDLLPFWTGMSASARYEPEIRLFPVNLDHGMGPECIFELQQFLRDHSRAGTCYVDGKRYAALSLKIAEILFVPSTRPRYLLQRSLQLAVDTLPFYLSHADYTLELANYFLTYSHDLKAFENSFSNVRSLQEAIDLYLKRQPRIKEPRQRDQTLEPPRKRRRQ